MRSKQEFGLEEAEHMCNGMTFMSERAGGC